MGNDRSGGLTVPYKDPAMKTAQMKRWRKKAIEEGYGKWLYARRKLRFDDAERFRKALEKITSADTEDRYGDSAALHMKEIAAEALRESDKASAELGEFHGPKS